MVTVVILKASLLYSKVQQYSNSTLVSKQPENTDSTGTKSCDQKWYLQMAGTAAADELNDRQRFRGFYRTEVPGTYLGPALADMARYFNWTQMAIISRSSSLFVKVCTLIDYQYSVDRIS